MHKVFILCQSYPNPKSGDVGSAFVHVRAKLYSDEFEIEVVKISKTEETYNHEGIKVTCLKDYPAFLKYFSDNKPKAVLSHFCESWMNKAATDNNIPLIIWVHGSEAHSWYRILFNIHFGNIKDFARFMLINTLSLRNFRRIIKASRNSDKIHFVFVSNWMKRITFFDTFTSTRKYSIIPNPIDTNLFPFTQKEESARTKILMLRSFNSSKYANDVAVDAIIKLSKKSFFKELEIGIYGKGVHWEKLTSKLLSFSNVKLYNKMLPQSEIPILHKQYGVFLCPTRMDAQGVSMCEAMSSGLVPITSNNTAIPEFVIDNESGYLTNSSEDIANRIEYLYNNPKKFVLLSHVASKKIVEKCGMVTVISTEKKLINEMINKSAILNNN